MIDVNDDTFTELVVDASSERIIIVDFWADWCVPCKNMMPILETLNNTRDDIEIVKFQASREAKTVMQYGVRTVPTLMMFRDGVVIGTRTGMQSRDALVEFIESAANHG